jgi:hypothetical protein
MSTKGGLVCDVAGKNSQEVVLIYEGSNPIEGMVGDFHSKQQGGKIMYSTERKLQRLVPTLIPIMCLFSQSLNLLDITVIFFSQVSFAAISKGHCLEIVQLD